LSGGSKYALDALFVLKIVCLRTQVLVHIYRKTGTFEGPEEELVARDLPIRD
jgi:hypothetical protein